MQHTFKHTKLNTELVSYVNLQHTHQLIYEGGESLVSLHNTD